MSTIVQTIAPELSTAETYVDFAVNFPLDENVLAALPPGTKVVAAEHYGSSAWTVTAQISTILQDGTEKDFFLKTAKGDSGRQMLHGEFEGMTEIYKTKPDFAPKPLAWGKYARSEPETYFFLCDFIPMLNELPDADEFAKKLADLHQTSESPTGKFGFHVSTCHGRFAQHLEWDSSWESFFRKLLEEALRLDREERGSWPELDTVAERVLNKVIPRLLGPLEADGRSVKPCLIHGDLWEGNIATSVETGDIYIFDAGAYYAHNEMEIGMWRCVRHQINDKGFEKAYFDIMEPSEPQDQADDRNRLYCVKMNIIHSAHHAVCAERQTAYEDMCYLAEKYDPEGELQDIQEMQEQEVQEVQEV